MRLPWYLKIGEYKGKSEITFIVNPVWIGFLKFKAIWKYIKEYELLK